jgi:ABC-type sugar transport system ATPase subunit
LPEVLNISTRVLVMRNGKVAGVLDRAEATQERVMQLMAGKANPLLAKIPSPTENN